MHSRATYYATPAKGIDVVLRKTVFRATRWHWVLSISNVDFILSVNSRLYITKKQLSDCKNPITAFFNLALIML